MIKYNKEYLESLKKDLIKFYGKDNWRVDHLNYLIGNFKTIDILKKIGIKI